MRGEGGDDTNRNSRSQDESQESSSGVESENMSSVDCGSEQSEFKSEDSVNGPPNAKKAKLGMEDVRGRVIETEAEQNVQQDSLD